MWNNIGHKLQTFAKILCWLGIIGSVIAGIAAIVAGSGSSYRYGYSAGSGILAGLLTIVLGSLFSWIGSWAMYGLGLVVEKVEHGKDL